MRTEPGLLSALKLGRVIPNKESWKRYQNLVNFIMVIFGIVVTMFPQLGIDNAQVMSAIGFFNLYVTTITSDTVGIK